MRSPLTPVNKCYSCKQVLTPVSSGKPSLAPVPVPVDIETRTFADAPDLSLEAPKAEKPAKRKAPAKAAKPTDPRHAEFKAACASYAEHKGVTLVWGPAEGKQLSALLQAAPGLTIEQFKRCLNNRAKSDGVSHGMRPAQYLPTILTFQGGPLDQYNKPKVAAAAAEPKPRFIEGDPYSKPEYDVITPTKFNQDFHQPAQEAAR